MLLKEKNPRYIIRTGNNLSMEVEPTLVIYEDTLSILRKQLRLKINTNLYRVHIKVKPQCNIVIRQDVTLC
jgi:hypothetical protein